MHEEEEQPTLKERADNFMVRYNALGWYIAVVATVNLVYTILAH